MPEFPSIEVLGLCKHYGRQEVLRGVDLVVRPGEVFALLGPNGAGKTTTVRILATLSTPDGGVARVAGHDVVTDRRAVRRRIALTGQYAALDEAQTGAENLQMMGRLARLSAGAARARTAELLARFGLEEASRRRVSTYSGGMRRRLDLAATLVTDPAVVFLDEPTTGLDPRSRRELWSVVSELARGGTTVLLTSQYLDEADRLADRVAVIDDGRVVATGTPAQLKRRVGGHRLEIVSLDDAAYADLRTSLADRLIAADPVSRTLSCAVEQDAPSVRALLDELDPQRRAIEYFTVHSASLDDVFLALTGSPSKEPSHV